MNFYPVSKITMTCPSCKAGIKLDVTVDDDEMQKLLTASESFACPICNEKFGGAHKLLEDVNAYNKSTKLLSSYDAFFNVKFE